MSEYASVNSSTSNDNMRKDNNSKLNTLEKSKRIIKYILMGFIILVSVN